MKALKLGTPIGGWHKVFWKGGGTKLGIQNMFLKLSSMNLWQFYFHINMDGE